MASTGGRDDPFDIFARIEAHVRHDAGEKNMRDWIPIPARRRSSFKIADRADALRAEQFEAPDVDPCQDDDRIAALRCCMTEAARQNAG